MSGIGIQSDELSSGEQEKEFVKQSKQLIVDLRRHLSDRKEQETRIKQRWQSLILSKPSLQVIYKDIISDKELVELEARATEIDRDMVHKLGAGEIKLGGRPDLSSCVADFERRIEEGRRSLLELKRQKETLESDYKKKEISYQEKQEKWVTQSLELFEQHKEKIESLARCIAGFSQAAQEPELSAKRKDYDREMKEAEASVAQIKQLQQQKPIKVSSIQGRVKQTEQAYQRCYGYLIEVAKLSTKVEQNVTIPAGRSSTVKTGNIDVQGTQIEAAGSIQIGGTQIIIQAAQAGMEALEEQSETNAELMKTLQTLMQVHSEANQREALLLKQLTEKEEETLALQAQAMKLRETLVSEGEAKQTAQRLKETEEKLQRKLQAQKTALVRAMALEVTQIKKVQEAEAVRTLQAGVRALLKIRTRKERARVAHAQEAKVNKKVSEFLMYVVTGEQDKAERLLKESKSLALQRGNIKDLSGRTFIDITGFQYALWALDWHMWKMLLKYLPKENAAEQLEELDDKGIAYKAKGKEIERETIVIGKLGKCPWDGLIEVLNELVKNWSLWDYHRCNDYYHRRISSGCYQPPLS